MSTFVQLVVTGKIDSKKDTKHLNEVLNKLQKSGAVIKSITLPAYSTGGAMAGRSDFALYIITYEANLPIDLN